MAQTGYTPIQIYSSSTASQVPLAVNLTNNTLGSELAINITDGKLYYKDNGGTVQLLASKAGASGDVVGPASATDNAVARFDLTTGKLIQNSVVTIGDTGDVTGVAALTASGNVTLSGGTANGVLYLNGSKVATSGSALVFDGTNFSTTGTATATKLIPTGNVTAGNGMYLPTTNTLAWSTNGAEGMRIDSSGNLGLGVTPSAWGSSQRAIDIGYSGALKSSTGSGSVVSLTNNAYYTNNWTYKITGQAAALYDLRDTGEHRWYTAPSGTAGNTITFTQAMTLDASGNLGVGTTSPSARLSIGTSSAATTPLNIGFVSEAYSTSNGSQSPYSPAGVALEIYPSTLVNSNAALINFSIPDGSGNYTGAYIGAIANNGVVNGSSPIVFGRRTGVSTWAESARITSSGAFLIGATATTGNGNFTNSSGSAVLTASNNSKTYNILYTANASNNATVDAWLGRDIGGGTIASSVLCGNFYVYVTGASGTNAYTAVYRIITTGNGTSPASFTLLESVTRGTSPVSSIQIANDGSGGAIKVTVTYINNSGVVTGGSSHISFVGVGI